jgi:hypothetical protein
MVLEIYTFPPEASVQGGKETETFIVAVLHDIPNSATNDLNSGIEVFKYSACGYRSKDKFRTAILFHCGKPDLMPTLEG